MGYEFDFAGLTPYVPAFLRGVQITCWLTLVASVGGTVLGAPLALAMRRPRWLAVPVSLVVDVTRAIPNLVLILFVYFFPYREMGFIAPSPFWCAAGALTAAQAAYSADLFRSAVDQVPRNQLIGLRALGFRPMQVAKYAILPSVVRQTLPAHLALWIGNLKLSSLASVIGVEDVVYVARIAMSQNFRSLESWLVVAAIYVVLVIPFSAIARSLENSAWIRRQ